MKRILIISLFTIAFQAINSVFGQGFVSEIGDEGIWSLYGNPCILKLKSGEEIQGKFVYGTYIKDGLSKISIKLENGEKVKFVPEQVTSLWIKASARVKLMMVVEASSSIKEAAGKDFNEIINREYIIFETALAAKKKDTYRLLQLLNPGFDNKIKVFAETSSKTGVTTVLGQPLTGGEDRAYLFVKGSDKAVMVKKGSYRDSFGELYADCPKMISVYRTEKIKWEDVALHVFTYDQVCK